MAANITIIGNLVGDLDLSVSPTGKSYLNFSLAYTPRRPDGTDGEVSFYNVTAWEYIAENMVTSFKKGDRLVVLARVTQDRWTDKDSGANRSKLNITAEEVAASVRFATVEVTRNAKKSSNGEVAQDESDDIFAS